LTTSGLPKERDVSAEQLRQDKNAISVASKEVEKRENDPLVSGRMCSGTNGSVSGG